MYVNPDAQFVAVREMARFILQNHDRFQWSFHGLGFLRLYLNRETRLHVWDTRYAGPSSAIHSHPWDFESLVVSGELRQRRFRVLRVHGSPDGRPYFVSTIRCGAADDAAERTPPEAVRLLTEAEETVPPGFSYQQHAEEVHESFPEPGTVTLIRRVFKDDPDHAQVYWPVGEDFRPAAPWHIKPEDISAIVANALTRF